MNKRRALSLTCLISAGLLFALAIASMWFAAGWNDTIVVAMGSVSIHTEIAEFTGPDVWLINLEFSWPRRLRQIVTLSGGLLVARSRRGRGRHVFLLLPGPTSLNDAMIGMVALARAP